MGIGRVADVAYDLELDSEQETAALARRIAAVARDGDVIALWGDLGAGKTAFARAFVNALSGAQEEVPSPTFTLAQAYRRGEQDLWHFDLYRLKQPEDAYELGVEEAFSEAISLVEWPERLGPLLPRDRLDLRLSHTGRQAARQARLEGHGSWAPRLEKLFAEAAG